MRTSPDIALNRAPFGRRTRQSWRFGEPVGSALGPKMKQTIVGLIFFALWISTQPVFGLEPSLELRIDSPTKEFKDPDRFVLFVEIHNISGEPCVVFPVYIRRRFEPIDGQGARFIPYPGPVVDPWPTAILLNGGERKTIALRGVKKHGEGVWALEHGRYNLSVSLHVAPTSTFGIGNRKGKFENRAIWRGAVESNSMAIRYLDET